MTTWKCDNDKCGEVFYMLGRITEETRPNIYAVKPGEGTIRTMIETPCCPYCQSIRFHPIEVEVDSS